MPDDHLPAVRAARKAFVSQMETMMLEVAWRPFRHVCENFPREKGHMDCTGGKFYIWVSRNGLFAPFIHKLNANILPRQARDKRRES